MNTRSVLFIAVLLLSVGAQAVFAQQKMSLDDCINHAMENNISIQLSKNSQEIAKYNRLESYRGVLPNISLSAAKGTSIEGEAEYLGPVYAGVDPNTGIARYEQRLQTRKRSERNTNSLGIDASYTLFDGFNNINQIRKAGADLDAAEMNHLSEENRVMLLVHDAYYNLLKQQKIYEVNKIAVERSQGQLERTEKMFELGSSAKLDVYQSKVNLGTDKINLLTQKNVVEDARRYLNIIMGREPLEPLEIKAVSENISALSPVESYISGAKERQPLLKKFEFDAHSSQLTLSSARSVYLPRISAYFRYNRFHENLIKAYSNFQQNYGASYGISLSLNIFNGFTDYSNVQKAQINNNNVQENLIKYKRELESRIHQYYQNYKSYIEIIDINQENLEAAKEELRLAEERYTIGAGTSLEVREAQVKLTRAEQSYIAARYNALTALAQLKNEVGDMGF